jgi:hypothetical protein
VGENHVQKIVLVNVFSQNKNENVVKCYCIVDEQSNKSLIKPELFPMLGISGQNHEYLLKTCNGSIVVNGCRASNIEVQSLDGSCTYNLPTLIECNNKNEICTPANARQNTFLIKYKMFDAQSEIMLLLGRDVIEAHNVFDQVLRPPGTPFAQRIGLGWVVVGELCIGQIHAQDVVNVNKSMYSRMAEHLCFSLVVITRA